MGSRSLLGSDGSSLGRSRVGSSITEWEAKGEEGASEEGSDDKDMVEACLRAWKAGPEGFCPSRGKADNR